MYGRFAVDEPRDGYGLKHNRYIGLVVSIGAFSMILGITSTIRVSEIIRALNVGIRAIAQLGKDNRLDEEAAIDSLILRSLLTCPLETVALWVRWWKI
jgi:hypothetical protein